MEDKYFTDGWRPDERKYVKKVMLKEMEIKVDMFERRRDRWLKDGMRFSIQKGAYSDDHWDRYRNDKTNYCKRVYKKPLPPRKDGK